MRAEFAEKLSCPAPDCSGLNWAKPKNSLTLLTERVRPINYKSGQIEEVEEGSLTCLQCGRSYPISEFVPSFEQLFPEELQEEAEFWSRWYGFMWDKGYMGFFDLKVPMAPLITEGIEVLDPSSLQRIDRGGTHSILADHPLVREAEWVLDVGCGTGWSSLFLARRGHKVAAFDPSVGNMRKAKRYAIAQGVYIEYLGAAVGFLAFKPETFDAIFALHAIHHVPQLKENTRIMRDWLREGGAIAVDEHVYVNPALTAIAGELQNWARTEVYPQVRTLPAEALAGLPQAGHSSLEGAGSEDVLDALLDNFAIESFSSRFISLDSFGFNYYLSQDLDPRAYHYSASIVDRIYKALHKAFPEGAEYVTLLGRKDSSQHVASAVAPDAQNPPQPVRNVPAEAMQRLVQWLAPRDRLEEARKELEQANEQVAQLSAEVARMDGLIARKDSHTQELEIWARGMQKALRDWERLLQRGLFGKGLRLLLTLNETVAKRRRRKR